MKNKSGSDSAFITSRVLLGVFVVLAGVVLAVAKVAQPETNDGCTVGLVLATGIVK